MSETTIKRHYNRLESEALEMEQSIKRLENQLKQKDDEMAL